MALTVTGMGGLCLLAGMLVLGEMRAVTSWRSSSGVRGEAQGAPALPGGPLPHPPGRVHQERPVPLPLLAAERDGGTDAGVGVSALGDHGELGVFLLARLWPALSGTEAWFWLVGSAGLVTLLFGAWVALFQRDLKGLLAYSTISHLGLVVLLLGLNSPLAAVAAVFHIVNHAAFKASLFMAAGSSIMSRGRGTSGGCRGCSA